MIDDPFRVVSAAASMKGCMSAKEVSRCLYGGVMDALSLFNSVNNRKKGLIFTSRPIADGGDDTLESIAHKVYSKTVMDPFNRPISAKWGSFNSDTAIIELSKASGIALIKESELDPMKATTYGMGQLVKEAISNGYEQILLTIGGSATVDGGAGALSALGAKFFDRNGHPFSPCGNADLARISKIDSSPLDPIKGRVNISIACDVDSPLRGPYGSAAMFGPQKTHKSIRADKQKMGALIRQMDANLSVLNEALVRESGVDSSKLKGSGAAGGVPIGFCSLLGAKMHRGSNLILKLLKYDELKGANFVLTSEGFCDRQTLRGKAPFAVCQWMKGSYVAVVTGGVESEEVEREMIRAGASAIAVICDKPMTQAESIKNAAPLMKRAAFRQAFSYLSSSSKAQQISCK